MEDILHTSAIFKHLLLFKVRNIVAVENHFSARHVVKLQYGPAERSLTATRLAYYAYRRPSFDREVYVVDRLQKPNGFAEEISLYREVFLKSLDFENIFSPDGLAFGGRLGRQSLILLFIGCFVQLSTSSPSAYR